MKMHAFYKGDTGISPPLNLKDVKRINEIIYKHGKDCWPWKVDQYNISLPRKDFQVSNNEDASTLAFVIKLLKNEGHECYGEIFITYDCNDALVRLQIIDGKVLSSYRLHEFSTPESVTTWEPTD